MAVPAGTKVTSVRAGCDHGVALVSTGKVLAWGNDFVGALGDGHTGDVSKKAIAVRLPKGTKAKAIASGCQFSLALTTAGQVLAWGTNAEGQLGDGASGGVRSAPVRVRLPGGTKIKAISAGGFFGLALATTGRLYAWGDNGSGQLGNGAVGPSHRIPVRVRLPKGTRVRSLAAGGDHALALTTAGKLLAWGANGSGQLGDGRKNSAADKPVRVKLPATVKVTAIAAGLNHSLALTGTGRIFTWGDNSVGELGTGSTATTSATPRLVKLPAGAAATAIGAGQEAFFSLAIVRKA